jgi:hypothetical protein
MNSEIEMLKKENESLKDKLYRAESFLSESDAFTTLRLRAEQLKALCQELVNALEYIDSEDGYTIVDSALYRAAELGITPK